MVPGHGGEKRVDGADEGSDRLGVSADERQTPAVYGIETLPRQVHNCSADLLEHQNTRSNVP